MTRRELLDRSWRTFAVLAGTVALVAGCDSNSGGGQATVAPERQKEVEDQGNASDAFAKQQHGKKP
jgi:hypothetical protein